MPKVLLIQPTQRGSGGSLCKQRKIYLPGLAFPLLTAITPDDWQVEFKLEVVDDIDFDADVDLVGIGTMGHAAFRGLEIAAEFKRRGKPVFMGGYMASMMVEEALKHVDSVVRGDAEISYPLLLRDFEKKGRLERVYDHPIADLNGLPLPRYDLLVQKPIGNMLPVMAGRGCPHLCSFCSIACLYQGRYLTRQLDEVLRDIDEVRRLGYRRFYLIDDNIVGNPGFLAELCREIEPLGLRWASQCSLQLARNPRLLEQVARAGCEILSLGLESITQEGLDKLGKQWVKVNEHDLLLARFRDAGIMASSEMMVGIDSDTEQSIRATAEFIERNRIPIPRFYILTPMPGSELFEQYKREGRLLHEDFVKYDGTTCVHRPAQIEPERLT
ncbi:MAG: B12-binding domain-containing radical SAM protein, partial [Deltaproteobacteria bacterium]|nr:B12-binding domain-containing radical SAM protein [Deltaproteobacteria bacterium]